MAAFQQPNSPTPQAPTSNVSAPNTRYADTMRKLATNIANPGFRPASNPGVTPMPTVQPSRQPVAQAMQQPTYNPTTPQVVPSQAPQQQPLSAQEQQVAQVLMQAAARQKAMGQQAQGNGVVPLPQQQVNPQQSQAQQPQGFAALLQLLRR